MYKQMYHILFNAIADALELMKKQRVHQAILLLEQASRDAEEVYISKGEEN